MRLIDADAMNPMRCPKSISEMREWINEQPTVCDIEQIRDEIEAEIKACETAIDMYKEKPDIVLCYKTFIQGYTKSLQIIDHYTK